MVVSGSGENSDCGILFRAFASFFAIVFVDFSFFIMLEVTYLRLLSASFFAPIVILAFFAGAASRP